MRRTALALLALLVLTGCAPTAREPDRLALVRVLGVDGGGPVALAGVCGGVAEYFNIDPTIVRVVWALLAFFYGTSILLYLIMAFVVPEKPDAPDIIDVESDVREPRN